MSQSNYTAAKLPSQVIEHLYSHLAQDTVKWAATTGRRNQQASIFSRKWIDREGNLTNEGRDEVANFILSSNLARLQLSHPQATHSITWTRNEDGYYCKESTPSRFAMYKTFTRFAIDEYRKWERLNSREVFLSEDEWTRVEETTPTEQEESMTKESMYEQLLTHALTLPPKKKLLIMWRFGFVTMDELQKVYGCSRQMVQKHWKNLFEELKSEFSA